MGEYVNSKQMRFDKSHVSCGVLEAHHIPDDSPTSLVFVIANALYHKANGRPAAFVMFSDVVSREKSRGLNLANAIKDLKIGTLIETKSEVNPKSGNIIQVWLWHLDHAPFRKWYVEEYASRIDDKL